MMHTRNNKNYFSHSESEANDALFGSEDGQPSDIVRLPAELLILSRFGVRYAFLKAVWDISTTLDIPISRALRATGAIPEVMWLEAKELLARELARKRRDQRIRKSLMYKAVHLLKDRKPEYSAYRCITLPQKICFSALFSGAGISVYMQPASTAYSISIALAALYSTNILMRGYLLWRYDESKKDRDETLRIDDSKLPVYTIMVALYEESGQIHGLTDHLWQLDWPKDKLDIKLICE